MTQSIGAASRRSRYLFDWSAAACLRAADQSLDASTGQVATFSRASIKTAYDTNGVLRVVPDSLPAFQWSTDPVSGLSVPGVLVEDAVVNLCVQSEDWSTTWAAVGTPTRVAASNAAAGVSLDTIGDDAAGTLEGYSQTVTFTANSGKAVSLFVKQGTSTSSVIRLRDTSAGADRLLAAITWTGSVPTVTMTTGTSLGQVTCYGGVYRLLFQTTTVTAANTNSLQFYPATNAALTVASTGTIIAGGVQAENALAPGSYLKTTTVAVGKVADALSFACGILPRTLTVYAKIVDCGTSQYSTLPGVLDLGGASANPRLLLYRDVGNGRWIANHSDTSLALVVTATTNGSQVELRGVLNSDGSTVVGSSIAGATETTGTDATTLTLESAWSAATLTFNRITGGIIGLASFQSVRIAAGVQTMATMRQG